MTNSLSSLWPLSTGADRPAEPPARLLPQSVLQAMPWAVLALNRDETLTLVNPQAAYLLGKPVEELLSRQLSQIMPPSFPVALHQALHEAVKAFIPVGGEFFLPDAQQWIEMSTEPGEAEVMVFWQDITRRKTQQLRYLSLADSIPDVITRWDPELRLRYANAAIEAKTGHPAAKLLGKTFVEMGLPESIIVPFQAKLRWVFDTGQPQDQFSVFPTPLGERHYHSRFVPELLNDKVHRVQVVSHDVTELKQAEQELRASKNLLQAVFDSSTMGLQVLRSVRNEAGHLIDFDIVLANAAIEQMAGHSMAGLRLLEQWPRARVMGLFNDLANVVETGRALDMEQPYDGDGLNAWYRWTAVRLGDGVVMNVEDITSRKQVTDELMRLQLVQHQQLANAVLEAQENERKRIAESLHNGLGQLLYAAKLHLDQLASLVNDPTFTDGMRKTEQMLSTAITQTRELSHQLMPVVLSDFGLAAAVYDICHDFSNPHLRMHCFASTLSAINQSLALALYRIAQELANNIVKHADATEAYLQLTEHDGWLEILAQDNGRGFDPSQHRKNDMGMGLNALQDRVRLLDGHLTITSSPNHGTKIQVRVPSNALASVPVLS